MVRGKIEIQSRITLDNTDEEKSTLGLIYTPGVAYIATEISKNKELYAMELEYLAWVTLDQKVHYQLWKENLFYSRY